MKTKAFGHEKLAKPVKAFQDKFRKLLSRKSVTIAGILIFAAIGTILIVGSKAATPTANFEAEAGTRSGNASLVADSGASGGNAVKFSTATGACPVSDTSHVPGGPDGMGGCWPYEGNTGVPAGTVLSNYTGSCIITTANTVIDKKIVNCSLDIRAANVTITNSKITGNISIDDTMCGTSYSFNVSDTWIHDPDINSRALTHCNYTATRVDASGGQSMAWCKSCTIQDSYLHSPLEDPAGAAANHAAHNSTVRMDANATIKHNTLWCAVKEYPQPNGLDTSGCSANQTGYSHDGAPPHNSILEANLYMPTTGGYCSYGGSTSGDLASVHDIVFKNNIFKRGTTPGDHGQPVCGFYGPITSFDPARPGNQWINNRWDDGATLQSAN